jgi:hypothetical protein
MNSLSYRQYLCLLIGSLIFMGLIYSYSFSQVVIIPDHWTVSADLSLTYVSDDDYNKGYNGSSNDHNPFNPINFHFLSETKFTDWLKLNAEILADSGTKKFDALGVWVTLSNPGTINANLSVGTLATPFGTWMERSLPMENPLIGIPLIYSYKTRAVSDQAPTADQLLNENEAYRQYWLATVYSSWWDTGIELNGGFGDFEYAIMVTRGAPSDPVINFEGETNGGKGIVARIGWRPIPEINVGASYGRAPYLDAEDVASSIPTGKNADDYIQEIEGLDFSYSLGHFDFVSEFVINHWEEPNIPEPLYNTSYYLEGKYKFLPKMYYALRVEQMFFSKIQDSAGDSVSWDYPVNRVETGVGYYFTRDILGKLVYQYTQREGASDSEDHFVALQLNFHI